MAVKNRSLVFLLIFLSLVSIIPEANAAVFNSESFSVVYHPLLSEALNYNFSYPTLYQGDSAYMNVTLIIDYTPINCIPPEEVVIKWIGLQFDWMNPAEWIQKDLEPITIEHMRPSETIDFGKFEFQIPSNVTVGKHALTVCIKYDMKWIVPPDVIINVLYEKGTSVIGSIEVLTFYESLPKTYTITVHSMDEKSYKNLAPALSQQLTEVSGKRYLSGGAKSLLQQASSKYSEAASLAEHGEWSEALDALRLTQDILSRAPFEEINFIILLGAGTAVGLFVAVGLTLRFFKGRKEGTPVMRQA